MGYIIILLVVAFAVWRMLPAKGVHSISTEQLKQDLNNKNKQYIDVRTPAEYKGNHIRQFKNIPLYQLAEKTKDLSKDKEIVVICQSGMRSSKACKQLKKAGFANITNVQGGMNQWS